MDGLPGTEYEIEEFLAAFEAGTLPKERWTHGAHLLGGACYVHELGEAGATAQMRERVRAYNVAVGGKNTETSGYHETVTVFWIKVLSGFHRAHGELPRAEFAAAAVRKFESRRRILAEYYDFDVVNSREARQRWIAPNLRSLD